MFAFLVLLVTNFWDDLRAGGWTKLGKNKARRRHAAKARQGQQEHKPTGNLLAAKQLQPNGACIEWLRQEAQDGEDDEENEQEDDDADGRADGENGQEEEEEEDGEESE